VAFVGGASATGANGTSPTATVAAGGQRRNQQRSGRTAAARLYFQAGDTEAEPQLDLCFRQRAAGPGPSDSARSDRGIPQCDSAERVSGGAALSGVAERRSRCKCPSFKDRGALSPAEFIARLCSRLGEGCPSEGTTGSAVHH